jgi:serine/threonine protein kinase
MTDLHCNCRTTPFAAKNYLSTYKKIAAYSKHCKLKWHNEISPEVRELIRGMLHPKPPQRLGNTSGGIDELKGHQWFEPLDWDKLYNKEVRTSTVTSSPTNLASQPSQPTDTHTQPTANGYLQRNNSVGFRIAYIVYTHVGSDER